jgi:hypothetical protein
VGGQLVEITEKYFPIGDEAGFVASRDLERVYLALYSMQGADIAAVLRGTFDPAKIDQVAQNHVATKSGSLIVASSYAGRTLYTVNNVGFTILSKQTAICGTETGIRRALDRITDKRVKRDLVPWMTATLETEGAAFAVAGDFVNQPLPQLQIPMMGWVNGIKAARVVGNFHDPGLNIAGSFTYADATTATSAADGVRGAGAAIALLSIGGTVPKIQNLDVKVDGADVQYQFALDDEGLRKAVGAIAR